MPDDYKDEYLIRLKKSAIYTTLKSKAMDKDNEVIALVERAVCYSCNRTKSIVRHMGEFTLHDDYHLFRVLFLIEKLLSEQNINKLSIPELMLFVLCAFFHDIGMAPDEKEVLIWRKFWDKAPTFETEHDQIIFAEFKRYLLSKPDQLESIVKFLSRGESTSADVIKSYLISEFIRQTHADRARQIIHNDWNGKILFRDTDLTVELAQICFSHNEDALSLLDLDKNLLCGTGIISCLPLIGVILRLADILDFDAKRTPAILYSHLYVRHPVSLKEWSKHRAIEAWDIGPEKIQFSAKCSHPAIEASIHEFCNSIDSELSQCNNIISSISEFIKSRDILVKLPFKVNREKIKTQRTLKGKPIYIYRDTKFSLSKRQVIDLLMGTKLYGKPEVALRELLQNSIDACLLRQAQEIKWNNIYEPQISVRYFVENGETILEVEDNGTGMDQSIIDNYYSKIGSSFYKSSDFYSLKAESNADFTPTSRFGIGILSCFMVTETLIVDTKRVYANHRSSDALNITVEGQESIFFIREGTRQSPGTTTRLILRKSQNPWEKLTEEKFINFVESVIPNPPFRINIVTTSQQIIRDEKSFKKTTATTKKDFTWNEHENIHLFEISIEDLELGLVGSAIVAILESQGSPKSEVQLKSISERVEDEEYALDKKLELSDNSIIQYSNSITVNDEGGISKDQNTTALAKSKSQLSLHGIDVPTTLFPESWQKKNNQVKISWPFPLILIIDLFGKADLDLNSARTEIIMSEKWIKFEENLAFLVCSGIKDAVDDDYWNELKTILIKESKSEHFSQAINRISCEVS